MTNADTTGGSPSASTLQRPGVREADDCARSQLTALELFAGIGGIALGLHRAGFRTVGLVELDAWCRAVLTEHFPSVPLHDDVRTAVDWWRSEQRPAVDLVSGGFPCQPFSSAGLRRGVADDRWLWPPMFDVIRHVRPRYVLVENVASLVDDADAFGTVLADLASVGFDADWTTLGACAVGAPHPRERLLLVAYRPDGDVPHQGAAAGSSSGRAEPRGSRVSGHWRTRWLPEPDVDRVAHGIPIALVRDALHGYGNAVVPAVAEYTGRLIAAHARQGPPERRTLT